MNIVKLPYLGLLAFESITTYNSSLWINLTTHLSLSGMCLYGGSRRVWSTLCITFIRFFHSRKILPRLRDLLCENFLWFLSLSLPFHCQHYCHIFHHFSNFAFRSHLIKTVTKSRFKNDSDDDDDDDESCLLKDFREKSIRNVEP